MLSFVVFILFVFKANLVDFALLDHVHRLAEFESQFLIIWLQYFVLANYFSILISNQCDCQQGNLLIYALIKIELFQMNHH